MKRYDSPGPKSMAYPWPSENGDWVRYSEVEAEIEKARRNGYMNGFSFGEKMIRADERERICRLADIVMAEHISHDIYTDAIRETLIRFKTRIKSPAWQKRLDETAQEPKPLEKLSEAYPIEWKSVVKPS